VVSLLGGRVPESKESLPADLPGEYPYELTLLDTPPLPISLMRQMSYLWRERGAERHLEREAPLPVLDLRPWFRNLPEQIRALLTARGAARVMLTSCPAPVSDLWQDYPQNPFSWANSLLVHLLALTAMVLPFALGPLVHPASVPRRILDLTPLVLRLPPLHGHDDHTSGGGGGGASAPLPASRGALPPFAHTQFTPPMVQMPKVPPVLPMPATLIGPPELKLPEMKLDMPWGDPHGVPGPPSPGPGTEGGIGNGTGPGVGPGKGPGYGPGRDGGYGGDTYMVGGEVSAPLPIYSPDPSYSDEARKAKFQGIVLLWIVVDAQGLVHNIRVVKPLGMQLDEEAVKTVSTWKFKPALRQGLPVPVQVEVQVSFRLF